jgi:hypothetical protein
MSTNDFLKSDNIELLWEILIDEPFSYIPSDEMGKFRNYFNNELTLFYNTYLNSTEIKNNNLMSLNQIFLSKIIQQAKPPQQQPHPQQQHKVQQSASNLYKAEDLQLDRINKFESELSKKKQDFESSITLKKPPTPVFEDTKKSDHIPINEMEALIAQTLLQRNYDVSNIRPTENNNANWLQPIETSIKNENQTNNNNAIKYIKIGREQLPALTTEIIDIDHQPEKRVSWSNDSTGSNNGTGSNDSTGSTSSNSIFSKLKISENNNNSNNMEALQERITGLELKFETMLQKINMLLDKAN